VTAILEDDREIIEAIKNDDPGTVELVIEAAGRQIARASCNSASSAVETFVSIR